jgi:hypothetical protein
LASSLAVQRRLAAPARLLGGFVAAFLVQPVFGAPLLGQPPLDDLANGGQLHFSLLQYGSGLRHLLRSDPALVLLLVDGLVQSLPEAMVAVQQRAAAFACELRRPALPEFAPVLLQLAGLCVTAGSGRLGASKGGQGGVPL